MDDTVNLPISSHFQSVLRKSATTPLGQHRNWMINLSDNERLCQKPSWIGYEMNEDRKLQNFIIEISAGTTLKALCRASAKQDAKNFTRK
jgi:hypothetical protein